MRKSKSKLGGKSGKGGRIKGDSQKRISLKGKPVHKVWAGNRVFRKK